VRERESLTSGAAAGLFCFVAQDTFADELFGFFFEVLAHLFGEIVVKVLTAEDAFEQAGPFLSGLV
jgi:hypothetical protein